MKCAVVVVAVPAVPSARPLLAKAVRRPGSRPRLPAARTSARSCAPGRGPARSPVGWHQLVDDGPVREGNARVVAPLWPLREGTPERVRACAAGRRWPTAPGDEVAYIRRPWVA